MDKGLIGMQKSIRGQRTISIPLVPELQCLRIEAYNRNQDIKPEPVPSGQLGRVKGLVCSD